VDGVSSVVLSERVSRVDLERIFKVIDINNDNSLSVNEFSLFLTGAKLKREQRINKMDPALRAEVTSEVKKLF
jgi:Ca2+-binding EF-hand superfamily protein